MALSPSSYADKRPFLLGRMRIIAALRASTAINSVERTKGR